MFGGGGEIWGSEPILPGSAGSVFSHSPLDVWQLLYMTPPAGSSQSTEVAARLGLGTPLCSFGKSNPNIANCDSGHLGQPLLNLEAISPLGHCGPRCRSHKVRFQILNIRVSSFPLLSPQSQNHLGTWIFLRLHATIRIHTGGNGAREPSTPLRSGPPGDGVGPSSL